MTAKIMPRSCLALLIQQQQGLKGIRILMPGGRRKGVTLLLQDASDELFDFVACYFPLTFTPPPGGAHPITREDMASELERTIAALPSLAEHMVPLLLEKLASAVRYMLLCKSCTRSAEAISAPRIPSVCMVWVCIWPLSPLESLSRNSCQLNPNFVGC